MHQSTPSLEQLAATHFGNGLDKWSSYLEIYNEIFSPFRDRAVRLLEIGVQNGGSLELWDRYFKCAIEIIGCDIDPRCKNIQFNSETIRLVISDARGENAVEEIARAGKLDIVIDDGSHRSGDVIAAFFRYFPHLQPNGLYIIEDLHCAYWKSFDGELASPYSSISFLKLLVDIINFEHWHLRASRIDLLKVLIAHYGISIPDDALAQIKSIRFWNSLCIVEKAPTNELGNRIISGETFSVPGPRPSDSTMLDAHYGEFAKLALSSDTWHDRIEKQQAELNERNFEIAKQALSLERLSEEIDKQAASISSLQKELCQARKSIWSKAVRAVRLTFGSQKHLGG